jgi:hypothetical protein
MNETVTHATILRSPWTESLQGLLSQVEDNLMLVSPFVKLSKAGEILAELSHRGVQNKVRLVMLTDLRPECALSGSLDLEALIALGHGIPNFLLTHLPSLHAKVYIADQKAAIVTSGNLTDSGVSGNIEYGVAFSDKSVVTQIREDFEQYSLLGAKVSSTEIEALLDEVRELKELYQKAEQGIRVRARLAFKRKLQATHLQLLRHRAKGKTTHAIFSQTILFLLAKGPLRTTEIHPLIQRLHPDICDDSIDRVIDGVSFGKKWKHHVRTAQQFLKREGKIGYGGERWHLMSNEPEAKNGKV